MNKLDVIQDYYKIDLSLIAALESPLNFIFPIIIATIGFNFLSLNFSKVFNFIDKVRSGATSEEFEILFSPFLHIQVCFMFCSTGNICMYYLCIMYNIQYTVNIIIMYPLSTVRNVSSIVYFIYG